MEHDVNELLTNGSWKPTNDAEANWCIKKICEAEKNKKFWKEYYAEQLRKVVESEDSTINYFTALLVDYFDKVPHKKAAKSESYALPNGKLVFKAQQPEYKRDEQALVEWLERNGRGNEVLIAKSVNWSDFKKTIKTDGSAAVDAASGEIIDGITVIERPPVFAVEGVKAE